MTEARRSFLRETMDLAWSLYRAELRGPSPRTFANALAGAWRWMKGAAERKAALPGWARSPGQRAVSFGSMLQSPIRRSLTGQPYAATRAARAGYLTSRVGA